MAHYEWEKQTLRIYYDGAMNTSLCGSTSRTVAALVDSSSDLFKVRHHTMWFGSGTVLCDIDM